MSIEQNKLGRRSFLELGAYGVAGVLGSSALAACVTEKKKAKIPEMPVEIPPANIAVQLWTVREQIEKDAKATLDKLAEMGYMAVETAFFPDHISIASGAEMIKYAGLEVCSVHVELPKGDEKKRILEMAEAYACKKMVWHGWPEEKRYLNEAGTKELAGIFNEANAFCKENGLSFGLHNHWWEFEQWEDGRLPFTVLRDMLDEDIFFEIDTYWTKVAGQDPAKIVADYGKRAPLLHIKDGPAKWTAAMDEDKPDPMVAVGQGAQNFPEIVKAAAGNTEWMIVELDNCATDMMLAVKESYSYLTKNGLAKGNM